MVECDEITIWLASDDNDPGVQMLTDSEICDLVSKSCDDSEPHIDSDEEQGDSEECQGAQYHTVKQLTCFGNA